MKLKRLTMTAFGPYQNKVIEISDELNILYSPESAKTEKVRDFIEAMLFTPSKEEREQFLTPLGKAAGEMLIETDEGEVIRLVRDFNKEIVHAYDRDGEEVSEKYLDEGGNFALIAQDTTRAPENRIFIPSEDDLKAQLDEMMESPTLMRLYARKEEIQKSIESLGSKDSTIQENLDRIDKLTEKEKQLKEKVDQIHDAAQREIRTLMGNNEEITKELEKLEAQQNEEQDVSKRTKVLESNEKGANERISAITKQLNDLYAEQDKFAERSVILKSHFKLDRDELISDYEKLHYALDREEKMNSGDDTLLKRVLELSPILLYAMLIIGVGLDIFCIINPGQILNTPVTYLLTFCGSLAALLGGFFVYLQMKYKGYTEEERSFEPISAVEAVLQKYRKESVNDFEDFYDKSLKYFNQIADLDSDLEDIAAEIEEAKQELDRYTKDRDAYRDDLTEELKDTGSADEVFERREQVSRLEKMFQQNLKRIDSIENDENINNPVVIKTKDGKAMRAKEFEHYLRERIYKLKQQNKEIQKKNADEEVKKLEEELATVTADIEENEGEIEALNDRIEAVKEGKLEDKLTLAEKLSLFGVGLEDSVLEGKDVPFILDDPFTEYKPVDKARMIYLFRDMIGDEQTILVSNSVQLKKIFDSMDWKYKGTYL